MSRILLIDDDDTVRAVIQAMLRSAGHEVAAAADGLEGLDQIRRQPFDLVLCDIFMPGLDGIATLTELRRLDDNLPIVMMTAGSPRAARIGRKDNTDYLALARTLGATETIEKPFRVGQLTGLLADVLGRAGSPAVAVQ
jgi:two-component system, response regulator, stage 0 sporulation protein F